MKVEDLGHILNQIPDPSTRKAITRLWMLGRFNELRADSIRTNGFGVDDYISMDGDNIRAMGSSTNVDINIVPKGTGKIKLSGVEISGGTASLTSMGAPTQTVQILNLFTSDAAGKMALKSIEASVEPDAAHTLTIETKVPGSSMILGCSLRVDTEVSDVFNAAFTGGSSAAIDTSIAVAKNTKVNTLFNTGNLTTDETNIALQVSNNPGVDTFTAQGKVSAIVYFMQLVAMADL